MGSDGVDAFTEDVKGGVDIFSDVVEDAIDDLSMKIPRLRKLFPQTQDRLVKTLSQHLLQG